MSEHKQIEFGMEGSTLKISLDKDQDGKKSLTLKINMGEVLMEAFKKGEKIEGMKKVSFDFSGGTMKMIVDTDQDGEPAVELEMEVMEALNEAGIVK